MNVVCVTGEVIAAPELHLHEKSNERVWHFRLGIDTRPGKRRTEIAVTCWADVGRFLAQYLGVGDRVAIVGSLTHISGKGLVVSASQLARLGEEVAAPRDGSNEAAQWASATSGARPLGGGE